MATKVKTVTLTHPHSPLDNPSKTYRVQRVQNTVEYSPGQYLSKKEVDEICDATGWVVNITLRTPGE